jgi:predicted dehydrogenase
MTAQEKGILWEAGCHPVYLQLHFLNNITKVYAVGSKVKYPVYDEFAVLLQSQGQSFGIIEVSWVTEGSEKTYEITSADGKRAWPQVHGDYHSILELEKPELGGAVYSEVKRLLRYVLRSRRGAGSKLDYFVGHFYLIKKYLKSLNDGSPPPVPPEEGKKTVRLLECIEQSLNTREAVPVQ